MSDSLLHIKWKDLEVSLGTTITFKGQWADMIFWEICNINVIWKYPLPMGGKSQTSLELRRYIHNWNKQCTLLEIHENKGAINLFPIQIHGSWL